MTLAILIILGLALGSFVSALVWRTRKLEEGEGNYSIVSGRSMCPACGHKLAARDLVPVLSWLALRGRCRHCGQPISAQYPLTELGMAATISALYIFWPAELAGREWILFAGWLLSGVGLWALALYDLRWMLLPNKILHPTLAVAVIARGVYIFASSERRLHALVLWAASVLIASGVFWLLFQVSRGKWIGFGDVRLGLVLGTLLADPQLSLAMIFFASLFGCLAALPTLLAGQKSIASKMPYGPFLILATVFVWLAGTPVLDWYKSLILS